MGWTALILSSRDGHCEVVEALLDHGANIDQKTDVSSIYNYSLVILAAIHFVLCPIMYVLCQEHWSSLMMAAAKGQTKVGKILLERGAKIDCQDFVRFHETSQ